jgi:hypothetical protein
MRASLAQTARQQGGFVLLRLEFKSGQPFPPSPIVTFAENGGLSSWAKNARHGQAFATHTAEQSSKKLVST